MSVENVKKYLRKYNMEDNVVEFTSSSATVSLAASILNCKEEEIAKTLSFEI